MQLYQAPLEGITGYIYRQALAECFGGVDKYFAPFISPYEKRILTDKEKNQLCCEHNKVTKLVPQILTMDAKGYVELTDWLYENYGYDEFNLNFGCPSGTVVSKGRGAGALGDLDKLEAFLDEIFALSKYKISIKTRIGLHNADELEEILALYNKYDLEELIIHPRIRDELYKGRPHKDLYRIASEKSKNTLVYNGDVAKDTDLYLDDGRPITDNVMIGRAMIANPSVFRELKGGERATSEELSYFLDRILDDYSKEFSGEVPVLHKMKEIWSYMGPFVVETYGIDEKLIKKLIKSKHLSEYRIMKKEVLSNLNK